MRQTVGKTPLPSSLRVDGIAKLGQLNRDISLQLTTLLEDRCNSITDREAGADYRIWGLELDQEFQEVLGDELQRLALPLFDSRWRTATLMGNLVPSEPTSLGSGGGWHRDSNSPQFKVMILLSDVNSESDGAFSFIPRSHRLLCVLRTFNFRSRWTRSRTRWAESEISARFPRPSILTGKTGDIVAFNGAMIHRGLPNHGETERRALTFYLYPKGKVPPHIMAQATK